MDEEPVTPSAPNDGGIADLFSAFQGESPATPASVETPVEPVEPVVAPAAASLEVATPPAAAPPPAVLPVAAAAPPVAPVADAPQTPAVEPSPAAVAQPETLTPEKIAERRQGLVTQIAENYKIQDADLQHLAAGDFGQVLPSLAAHLYVDIYEAVVQAIQPMMQTATAQHYTQQQQQTEFKNNFFEKWPALKAKPEYLPTIARVMGVYRQLNPTAPVEQVIQEVGAHAMATLQLPPNGAAAAVPAAPPATTPAVQPTTFQPVAPGATSGTLPGQGPPAPPANPWTELAAVVQKEII